jgi:hypothetical protein
MLAVAIPVDAAGTAPAQSAQSAVRVNVKLAGICRKVLIVALEV